LINLVLSLFIAGISVMHTAGSLHTPDNDLLPKYPEINFDNIKHIKVPTTAVDDGFFHWKICQEYVNAGEMSD
jgi:hypothetical protein